MGTRALQLFCCLISISTPLFGDEPPPKKTVSCDALHPLRDPVQSFIASVSQILNPQLATSPPPPDFSNGLGKAWYLTEEIEERLSTGQIRLDFRSDLSEFFTFYYRDGHLRLGVSEKIKEPLTEWQTTKSRATKAKLFHLLVKRWLAGLAEYYQRVESDVSQALPEGRTAWVKTELSVLWQYQYLAAFDKSNHSPELKTHAYDLDGVSPASLQKEVASFLWPNVQTLLNSHQTAGLLNVMGSLASFLNPHYFSQFATIKMDAEDAKQVADKLFTSIPEQANENSWLASLIDHGQFKVPFLTLGMRAAHLCAAMALQRYERTLNRQTPQDFHRQKLFDDFFDTAKQQFNDLFQQINEALAKARAHK